MKVEVNVWNEDENGIITKDISFFTELNEDGSFDELASEIISEYQHHSFEEYEEK